MGMLNKEEKVLQQDLNKEEGHPGMIFMIHLLMEEMCEMPDKQFMHEVMNKHLGDTDCFCHDGKVAGFAPKNYTVHFEKENQDIPPQLMIMDCIKTEKPIMDEIAQSQLWDCPEGAEIFDNDNPIKSNDHIDGIKDGRMSQDVQWNVQYENSLIQPVREVLDINMGEYASGIRS